MPFDEQLAVRVRKALSDKGRIEEKSMFGGLTFMLDGKMCVGVEKARLMVRVDPEHHPALLKRPGASPMDFTGRPMKGYLFVQAKAVGDAKSLKFWIDESTEFVRTVPAKKARKKA